MLTVVILINGQPLMARSAVNSGCLAQWGNIGYDVDDGTVIYHNPDDGAVALAIELLKTIKEQGVK